MIVIMSNMYSFLFENGRSTPMPRGKHVFHTGDTIQNMYLLENGKIDLVRHAESGVRVILHRVLVGNVLAEASAYSKRYHCDGVAQSYSAVRSIPRRVFCERLEKNPSLSKAWSASLAHALQQSRMSAELRTLRTVAARLDAWISVDRPLPPKGEWQDLAETLGVSREALYRELAKRRQV